MKRALLVLTVAAVTAACSAVGIRSGTEQPTYEVVGILSDGLEIRQYPSRLAAETVVDAEDQHATRRVAFQRLFNYISGDNTSGAEIAMTAPVEMIAPPQTGGAEIAMTAPVEITDLATTSRMRFFLPAAYDAATAPQPTDDLVDLVTVPGQTMAVLRFTGSTDRSDVSEYQAQLLDALAETPWIPQGPVTAYFYDPPWTLPFLRRNEVAVVVDRVSR